MQMLLNVKRCSKCVLSEKFPGISFDNDGVCNFCRDTKFSELENKAIIRADKEIKALFEENAGKSQYDAILCYSGGKDSTYTMKLAKEKYGLNILSFTLDNGFISDQAFDNINRVVENLGVDHIVYKPSKIFMKDLYKVSSTKPIYNPKTLTRISANCNSCISIINITALRMALERNIPFILAGFTLGQIPQSSIYYKNNYNFFKESREPILERLREHLGNEVDRYLCIDQATIDKSDGYPYNINLLCLESITETQIISEVEKIGWVYPNDVDGCSSNCRINTFNNYVHQQTLEYNPYELELSRLIRTGLMSREEAIEKIENQPVGVLKSIINELGIDKETILKLPDIYKL